MIKVGDGGWGTALKKKSQNTYSKNNLFRNVFTHMKGPDDPGSSKWHKLRYLQLRMGAGSSFQSQAMDLQFWNFNLGAGGFALPEVIPLDLDIQASPKC